MNRTHEQLEKAVAKKMSKGGWNNTTSKLAQIMADNPEAAQRYSGRLELQGANKNLTKKARKTLGGNPKALARLGSKAIKRYGGDPSKGWGND